MDYDESNCFVCSEYLGPFRNGLNSVMDTSGKLIYKLLESLLDISINKSIRKSSSACQDCFIKLQKYEDLQMEAENIQVNLINLFHKQSTDKTETVSAEIDNIDNQGMVIRCTRCMEQFDNIKELSSHKNCEHGEFLDDSDEEYSPKRKRSKTNLNLLISDDFKELVETKGIDYNIESFHRAFGAPVERENIQSYEKEARPVKPPNKQFVSPEFAKMLEQHGIDYNLQTFHRVFGFSDSLDLPRKSKSEGFKCTQCGEEFMKLQPYKDHVKTHTKGDYKCDECQVSFQSKPSLNLHLSSNHGKQKEGPFVCPVCLKTFRKKEFLRSHLLIHDDERKYLCTQCGASFIHRRSFQMHLMVHDDIRPYECGVCSKRFRSKTKLSVHLRIHTGERKYECPHCPGKTFRQKWGMDLHIKKIHLSSVTVESELCQICGSSFQHKSKLRQHLKNSHQVANAEQYGDYDEDQ